jgi:thiamine biosynthesis lipoprotein
MFARALWLCLLAVVATAPRSRADVYLTEEQALKLAFPGADRIDKRLLALTASERDAIAAKLAGQDPPRVFKLWIGRKGAAIVGYAVIDDVLGKSEPITYMLAVDEKLSVRSVEILAYRESRGGEVRQPDWRAQFAGKDATSALRVGKDIRNIAGATISCRALTDGVRRELACLSVLASGARCADTDAHDAGTTGAPARSRADGSAPTAAERNMSVPIGESTASHAAGSAQATLVTRSRLSMGTALTIRAYVADAEAGMSALEPAFAEAARLDAMFTTFRDESEVSRLNRAAGGDEQPASPELLELCAASIEKSRLTQGAFDVTVGPLIALWRNAADSNTAPSADEIRSARQRVGWHGIELDRAHGRMRLARAGMALDFGAIGKGYALDRAAAQLEARGIHAALLDFGGQLLALDAPPGETAWIAEVRDPAHAARALTRLRLVRASISSTADYERGMMLRGRRISHVVDPRTGMPVEGMLGASVVAPTATEADALSTALYVLGFEGAQRHAEVHHETALIVAEGARVARTPGFAALELLDEAPR